jgi:hypothetical protein
MFILFNRGTTEGKETVKRLCIFLPEKFNAMLALGGGLYVIFSNNPPSPEATAGEA